MAFDLDNEELKATRKDKGLDDGLYEDKSDKNVANIEDDIKTLIEENPSHKKEQAIEHILSEREQDKKRIQELEADLYSANCTISDYVDSIPKQKVKDKIEEYDKKMTEDAGNSLWVVTDRIVMNVLNELLEDK